jgi:hypothetical protein
MGDGSVDIDGVVTVAAAVVDVDDVEVKGNDDGDVDDGSTSSDIKKGFDGDVGRRLFTK